MLPKKLCVLALGVCQGVFPAFGESIESPEEKIVVSQGSSESGSSDSTSAKSSAGTPPERSSPSASQRAVSTSQVSGPSVPWDFSQLAAQVVRGVVSITAVQAPTKAAKRRDPASSGNPFDEFFRFFPQPETPRKIPVGGSGFIISMEKDAVYIGTNYHIVEEASNVKVQLDDKCEIPATVHGSDPRTDLAVLKVNVADIPTEKRQQLVVLPWGQSSSVAVGQWVLAVGNPFGLGSTVTAGIISAKGRDLHIGGVSLTDDFIQHSAQINYGNSGGCLINMLGEVIGINTIIVTPSGGNVGIGFAIPSDNAKIVLEQLITHKKVRHGALGISVSEFTKDHMAGLGVKNYRSGVVIMRVDKSGPAAEAGFQEDDVIVKFDDTIVENMHQLSRTVDNAQVNTDHKVTVIRKGKELVLKTKIGDFAKLNGISTEGDRDDGLPAEILGLSLSDLPPSKPDDLRGALVRKVAPDSAADNAGLRPQDIIVAVNQEEIRSAQECRSKIIKAAKNQDFVLLKVNRSGATAFIAVKISDDTELRKSTSKSDERVDKTVHQEDKTSSDRKEEASTAKAEEASNKMSEMQNELGDTLTSSVVQQVPQPERIESLDQEKRPGLWSRFISSLKQLFGKA